MKALFTHLVNRPDLGYSVEYLMKAPRCISLMLALLCSASVSIPSFAVAQSSTAQTAPDNSGHNKHQAKTADSQSNAKTDRLTTAKARRAIIADKGLSMYAHNVKIITTNGMITLKGPVKSEEEKQKVASDLASVVSADKVTNQLTVKQ